METVRIDKWLWAVRVFKTRSLATGACRAGHVKIAGQSVKPARDVHVGEIITAFNGHFTRTLKVLAVLEQRVGAGRVTAYADDQTPAEERLRRSDPGSTLVNLAKAGRPSKKARRTLTRLKERL
jgi:ribosome-associated heat shock protein Hsp15